jgi:phosphoribosylformylglycinamidine synthase
MDACVVVFPGSNCDRDVKVALEAVGGKPVRMVWHAETELPRCDLIVLPGGFAYGDYLRCGAMAAHSNVMRDVIARAKKGTPVLGICNGFQVLTETELLPGVLLRNASLKFVCRDVLLKVEQPGTLFTSHYRQDELIRIPVAHGDGNYFADQSTLDELEGEGRVVFRYADNPNGSMRDIAGVSSANGRVVGLMPHPEHATEALTGPSDDGLGLFYSALDAVLAAS